MHYIYIRIARVRDIEARDGIDWNFRSRERVRVDELNVAILACTMIIIIKISARDFR